MKDVEHELFERLRDVTGDHGARNLLLCVRTRELPCDDLSGGRNMDMPAPRLRPAIHAASGSP